VREVKFLVDQPISWQVAEDLRSAGHDAVHVCEIGLSSTSDSVILEYAGVQQRVVVTQDTDFGTLLALSGATSPSIVLFRMSDGKPKAQSRILLANLLCLERDLSVGAIAVFTDSSIRIRRLPLR
jgi:predicted nuclease of predicted toxin-antitoxin system